MSYCRIGEDSDVYVIRSGDRWICHCDLVLNEADRPEEMISHLLRHRSFRHKVPQHAIERLNADRFDLPYRPTRSKP